MVEKINFRTLIILLFFVACIGVVVFKSNRPKDVTAFDFAYDFGMALRTNDPVAYEMAGLALNSRIDDWMATHEIHNCTRIPSETFRGGGHIESGFSISFGCQASGGWYHFFLDDVFIERQETGFLVVDWGEIEEEFP